MLSVIIPANNESDYIGRCLESLLASSGLRGDEGAEPAVEVIVVANGCTDTTVETAERYTRSAAARGWRLIVLDLAQGGKLNALNAGDLAASGTFKAYMDADVIVSPPLLSQLCEVLDRSDPAYASGRPTIGPARSWISRAYARVWRRVPFMTEGVPGFGVFAVNAAGRARWGAFPEIISDDTFTRLQFAPFERHCVPARYEWPIVEGFAKLVRVRRRQDIGVTEIATRYPALLANDNKPRMGVLQTVRLALSDPLGFGVYTTVSLAVRLPRSGARYAWTRGR